MELPPGFRFHPSDEELITHYLSKKVLDSGFSAIAMGDVDLNKVEPWDLPWKAKMGEKEWYFFCLRDKKYPTGLKTNRATAAGYWKATGRDKEILQGKSLVGMRKTLVFYRGRAPRGEKTNWVMHEYRLEGKFSLHNLPPAAKNEWVICRVFEKSAIVKKFHCRALMRLNPIGNEVTSLLPSSTRSSPYSVSGSVHAPCFSYPNGTQNGQQLVIGFANNSVFDFSNETGASLSCSSDSTQVIQNQVDHRFPCPMPIHDQTFLRGLIVNYGSNTMQSIKTEDRIIGVSHGNRSSNDRKAGLAVSGIDLGTRSFDDHEVPSTSAGLMEHRCVWDY